MVIIKDDSDSPDRRGIIKKAHFDTDASVQVKQIKHISATAKVPATVAPPSDAFASESDSADLAPAVSHDPVADLEQDIEALRAQKLAAVEQEVAEFRDKEMALAKDECQHLRDTAYQQGVESAHADFQAEMQQHVDAIKQLFDELGQAKANALNDARPDIFKLALAAAEKIINAELSKNPGVIEAILNDALRRITDKDKVIVRINPEDAVWIRDQKEWVQAYLRDIKELIIQDDPTVSRGGCIVETKLGYIDSSIKSKIASLDHAFQAVYEDELANGGDSLPRTPSGPEADLLAGAPPSSESFES